MINGCKIVAMCTARLGELTSYELVSSLNNTLVSFGHRLLVYNICTDLFHSDVNEHAEAHIFDLIDFNAVDAVVIAVEKIKSEVYTSIISERAKEHGIPVVIVDGFREGCANVNFDYKKGFEKVVRHVTDFHGITDIHFIGGHKGNSFSEDRKDVLKAVLAEKGIDFGEDRVSYGDFWELPTKAAANRLISENRVPKAVICANDIMAIHVTEVFKEHGLKIPEDVVVTGFDGVEDIYFSIPRITSCSCNHLYLGRKVAQVIDAIFKGELEMSGDYFVEPEMIVADSCGCHNDENINVPFIMHSLNSRVGRMQEDSFALSRRTERIQNASSVGEVSKLFDSYVFADMEVMINKRCFDPANEVFTKGYDEPFDDEMIMLRDFGGEIDLSPVNFERKRMVPNFDRLFEIKCPIVFSALDYLNVPVGYVVFFYFYDDPIYYCRIPLVVNALNNAIGGYVISQTQKFLLERIEKMYKYDSLTGLHNRLSFTHEFEVMRSEATESGKPLTVVLADLDDLKGINDKYGHVSGDKAIRAVADALRLACPEEALVVRLGGDEMMAVIIGTPDYEVIRTGVDMNLFEFNQSSGEPYTASASVGIYTTADSSEMTPEALIKRSDALMYEEKRRKKMTKRNPII